MFGIKEQAAIVGGRITQPSLTIRVEDRRVYFDRADNDGYVFGRKLDLSLLAQSFFLHVIENGGFQIPPQVRPREVREVISHINQRARQAFRELNLCKDFALIKWTGNKAVIWVASLDEIDKKLKKKTIKQQVKEPVGIAPDSTDTLKVPGDAAVASTVDSHAEDHTSDLASEASSESGDASGSTPAILPAPQVTGADQESESLSDIMLKIMGNPAPNHSSAVIKDNFPPELHSGLIVFLAGRRRFTREWIYKKRIRQILAEKFPEGWTQHARSFNAAVAVLPANHAEVKGHYPLDPIKEWRHDVADFMVHLRRRSEITDIQSHARRIIDRQSQARGVNSTQAQADRLAGWINAVELASGELPIAIVQKLLAGAASMYAVNLTKKEIEKLAALKNGPQINSATAKTAVKEGTPSPEASAPPHKVHTTPAVLAPV